MEIKSSNNNLFISGNIKSIAHYRTIEQEVDKLINSVNNIQIHILDSISLTSSVIGYFCKMVDNNDVAISLFVKDENLHELLNELNLIALLNVRKI
jgi:hypothetical protein